MSSLKNKKASTTRNTLLALSQRKTVNKPANGGKAERTVERKPAVKRAASKEFIKEELRCGDCSKLCREKRVEGRDQHGRALRSFFCQDEGRLPEGNACSGFTPDIHQLVEDADELTNVAAFGELVADMAPSTLRILAGILVRETRTRKFGFEFMQPVYLRYRGTDDYVSNFCLARILDVTKERIRLVSVSNRVVAVLTHPTTSILSVTEYMELKGKMEAAGKIIDPAIAKFAKEFDLRRRGAIDLDFVFEHRTIDDELVHVEEVGRKKSKKRPIQDLASYARDIERGVLATPAGGQTITINRHQK